jgi:hypothetical protein
MNLEAKIEKKGSYILATILGDFDLNKALEIFIEILKDASENNVSKILIDFRRMASRPSYLDELTYATKAAKFWRDFMRSSKSKNPKLAYVADQILDADRTGVLTAENRGAFNFELFQDIRKAEEWIQVDDY